MNGKGTIWIVIGPILLVGSAIVVAQSSTALPTKFAGHYQSHAGRGGKTNIIPVELADVTVDGDNVRGILSNYRSPASNCLADNTPFSGTYRDGTLSVKTQRLKSQVADGRPCGGVTIEVTLTGARGSGTIRAGSDAYSIDLEAK